jgi:hypothetical protein
VFNLELQALFQELARAVQLALADQETEAW